MMLYYCIKNLQKQRAQIFTATTDFIETVKALYSDIHYNSKILYNINSICTNVPIKLKFKFITTEIQFSLKLFGDKQCRCKEGWL